MFPTSYDVKASYFGDPVDQFMVTLDGAHLAGVTLLHFNEATVDALELPCYLTFLAEDSDGLFEIVKATAKPATKQLTVARGALGSTDMDHVGNEQVVQDLVSAHLALMRTTLEAVQRYQGLVGLAAALPGTCAKGESYVATNTGEVFYAVATNTWRLIDRLDHGSYTGLGADDHAQYHTDARKDTWHDALAGEHITELNHDHSGEVNMGLPATRFRNGLADDLPNPTEDHEVYYATDTGDLYFSFNSAWVKYSVMPVGTIIMFVDACPQGWTRLSDMDDKFPRGAPTGVYSGLTDGGGTSHRHEMATVLSHTHTIASVASSLASNGGGEHSWPHHSGGTGGSSRTYSGGSGSTNTSSTDGAHSHTVTIPAYDVDSLGDNPAYTDYLTGRPPYRTYLFCQKDA